MNEHNSFTPCTAPEFNKATEFQKVAVIFIRGMGGGTMSLAS
jgi:hypothetical protein